MRRLASLGAVTALCLAQAGPALAATVVAQANATGLELTIGGSTNNTGTFTATHDGTTGKTSGNNQPLITALGGQSFIQAGTLAQDAVATVEGKKGVSAACAGLAGDGATLVEAGDGECLSGGDNLNLTAATLDFSDLTLVQSGLLAGIDPVIAQLMEALSPVFSGLQGALQQALTALDGEVVLDLGAVQSTCEADPDSATGDAGVANSGAYVSIGGQKLTLVDLPAKPDPNTKILTNLDKVAQLVQDDISAELKSFLQGEFGAVAGATDAVFDAIIDNVIAQIAPQLAPLEENILDGTLNKQVKPSSNSIIVTALDLRVLPAAAEFGVEFLSIEIGRSHCGPNSRVTGTPNNPDNPNNPNNPSNPGNPGNPQVPTSVPAGAEGSNAMLSLGMLLLLAGGSGLAVYRRLLTR
ncbi:hypothetical protein [Nocardioides sp.]|uniref:hypothetical protein n=1 Tax=Nocardioides sp. TaxID=35761 RepID=UPI003562726F